MMLTFRVDVIMDVIMEDNDDDYYYYRPTTTITAMYIFYL